MSEVVQCDVTAPSVVGCRQCRSDSYSRVDRSDVALLLPQRLLGRIRPAAEDEVRDRPEEVDAYDRRPDSLTARHLFATASREIQPSGQSHCRLNRAENDDDALLSFAHVLPGSRARFRHVVHLSSVCLQTATIDDGVCSQFHSNRFGDNLFQVLHTDLEGIVNALIRHRSGHRPSRQIMTGQCAW